MYHILGFMSTPLVTLAKRDILRYASANNK